MNSGLRDQSDFNFAIEYDYESKPITPLNAITIKKKKWEPTSKYDRTLSEVRNQATPGELYRRYYLEFGKHEKNLAALAERTVLHHEVCAKAVLALQSRLRGRKGQLRLALMRPLLEDERTQREIKKAALIYFENGEKQNALDKIKEYDGDGMNITLLVMKCKLFYSLEQFSECQELAEEIIELDSSNIDAYYLLACCLSVSNEYEQALQTLSTLFGISDDAQLEHILRLNAFLCTRTVPPQFDEAILTYNILVQKFPEHMDSLLQRACCFVCLQDWNLAVADYSLIIEFQPNLLHVICLRARAYACQRKWPQAKADYEYVLRTDNENMEAVQGLEDISQIYEKLPMLLGGSD